MHRGVHSAEQTEDLVLGNVCTRVCVCICVCAFLSIRTGEGNKSQYRIEIKE